MVPLEARPGEYIFKIYILEKYDVRISSFPFIKYDVLCSTKSSGKIEIRKNCQHLISILLC